MAALILGGLAYRFLFRTADDLDRRQVERSRTHQPAAYQPDPPGGRLARMLGERLTVRGSVIDMHSGDGVGAIGIALVREGPGDRTGQRADGPVLTSSDKRGRYQLTVAPGRYRVVITGPALAAQPGQILILPRPVGGAATAEHAIDILVVRMARVSGRVVDPDGQPLADVPVAYRQSASADGRRRPAIGPAAAATPQASSSPISTSDRNGAFHLLVPPGQILLYARTDRWPESHTSLRWVEPGAHLTGVEIVMDTGATIAGLVVDSLDSPVAGAIVRGQADDEQLERTATTGEDGRFTLSAMRPGRVVVSASAPGLAPSTPAVVQVQPGDHRDNVRLVLSVVSEIRGRVLDDTGRLLAAITVRAQSAMVPDAQVEARTDGNGQFVLTGLAAAPYVLIAEGPGVASARVSGITAPARDIDIVVSRTGAVGGQVAGVDGRPLPEFWIRLDRRVGLDAPAGESMVPFAGESQHFITDDGAYFIDGVRPGTYDVSFFAAGLAVRTVTDVQVPAGGEAHASAQLGPGGAIRGRITDASNQAPVRGVAVRLSTGSEHPTVYTDAGGQFTIPDIAVGRRSLEVEHPAYVGRIATGIEVALGPPRTVDIALERLPFGSDRKVEFAGIGAVLAMDDGILRVQQVLRNGPSEVAGLQAGDGITHTDGVPTGDRSMAENIESIRGVVGTVVRVTVERGQQRFMRDIVRASIRMTPGDVDAVPEPESEP